MNSQIQKLQHQAMSLVLNGNDPDGDVEKMYIPAEFTKKFAELIVRECAAIADKERPTAVGCGYITKTKGELIMEHFGVES